MWPRWKGARRCNDVCARFGDNSGSALGFLPCRHVRLDESRVLFRGRTPPALGPGPPASGMVCSGERDGGQRHASAPLALLTILLSSIFCTAKLWTNCFARSTCPAMDPEAGGGRTGKPRAGSGGVGLLLDNASTNRLSPVGTAQDKVLGSAKGSPAGTNHRLPQLDQAGQGGRGTTASPIPLHRPPLPTTESFCVRARWSRERTDLSEPPCPDPLNVISLDDPDSFVATKALNARFYLSRTLQVAARNSRLRCSVCGLASLLPREPVRNRRCLRRIRPLGQEAVSILGPRQIRPTGRNKQCSGLASEHGRSAPLSSCWEAAGRADGASPPSSVPASGRAAASHLPWTRKRVGYKPSDS